MKSKHILILAIILGLLVVGVAARKLHRPAELVTEEYAPLDLSFDVAQVAAIDISKSKPKKEGETAEEAAEKEAQEDTKEEFVKLVKKDESWKLDSLWNARSDADKIDRFLKEIREAKGELRAGDKNLFSDFGIADDQAYRVVLSSSSGESLLTLLVGVKKADYRYLFVRKDGSDQVYLTEANLYGEMGIYGDPEKETLTGDYWAATDLAEFGTDQVEKLETRRFKDGKEILTSSVLRETDPADSAKKKWKFGREGVPFALDAEKVKEHLNSFKGWRAQKVLDPAAKDYGFAKPAWRMNLGLEGGREIVITAGGVDEESKAYYMQVATEPVVFQLTHYYFENMDIDDSKFFIDNPLEVDPDRTEKLVIRADKKEMSFKLKEKKWDSLTGYLNDLKTFQAAKLLFDPADQKKVRPQGRFWIEIQKEGGSPQAIDIGDLLSETAKEYAAAKRGPAQPFAISEAAYKKLFENPDRLAEPKGS